MPIGVAVPESLPLVTFLVAIISILAGAKVFGEIAQRLGQPAVLGEIVAGLLLGPYALGLVPDHEVIHLLAEVGVLILLFEIGLELDLADLLRVGHRAVLVALVGVALPYLGGHLFATLLGYGGLVPVVLGAALTATSVGITARVLADLGKLDSTAARIILGAAVLDDILGIVLLSVVHVLGEQGSVSFALVAWSLFTSFGFLIAAMLAGRWLAPMFVRFIDRARVRGVLIVGALVFALLLAVLASLSGSAPLIGALAGGMLLARTHRREVIEERVRPIADFFTPIFFVGVGAAVNLAVLTPFDPANWPILGLGAGLTAIAILGKLAAGLPATPGSRLAVGVGMIPRGEVGLVFAGMGRATGVLNPGLFAALVFTVLVSTVIVPPLLRQVLLGQAPPPHAGEE
jgi:Kef-type K+ transport system membrane component KefB